MLKDNSSFVYLHGDTILIGTSSGPGACVQMDFDAPVLKKPLNEMTDRAIGGAIRNSWRFCRFLNLKNSKEIVEKHMDLMGVKNKKSLYENTKCVNVMIKNGIISAWPTIQNRLGGFEGIKSQLKIPEEAADEEIGALVRQALDESKSNF